MEATLKSTPQGLRASIGTIEAIELAALGFVFWLIVILVTLGAPDVTFTSNLAVLFMIEGALLGSWLIYNLYIRIARAGGKTVDIGIWVIAAAATASYTFWAWTILDVNRWIIAKFLYRGEAPAEYAWSVRSKQVRKLWEQARKASK